MDAGSGGRVRVATYARARARAHTNLSAEGPVNRKMGSRGGSEKKKKNTKDNNADAVIQILQVSATIAKLSTCTHKILADSIMCSRLLRKFSSVCVFAFE